jgi:ribosomal protein L11 methyltransferase
MNYLEVIFTLNPYEEYISDLLMETLGEIGFDSFQVVDKQVFAYIQENNFNQEALDKSLSEFDYPVSIHYSKLLLENKDWNEEWEKNFFQPILIEKDCVIHSSFHQDVPKAEYDIVIDPKMAFGSGHHETTELMLSELLKINLKGKNLLDMGCGTAVLSILASFRGAASILAVDIDDWCIENSMENIRLNKINNIEIRKGGAKVLENLHFDVVLANINRNVLLNDIKFYAACLSAGGELYLSGFYVEDIPLIEAEAKKHGLQLMNFKEKNNWALVKTIKK